MPDRVETKRTLRSPKSRGGCGRCKAKHIKCDEAKPYCQICRANGVECPGYAKQLRWSNKHERFPRAPQARVQAESSLRNVSPAPTMEGVQSHAGQQSAQMGSAEGSENASPSQDQNTSQDPTSGNTEMDMFEWPNLDNYGFEDLGLSTPLGHSIWGMDIDTNLAFPYFGGMGSGGPMPQMAPHLVEDVPYGMPSAADHKQQKPPRQAQADDNTRDNSRSPSEPATESANLLQTFYRLSVPSAVPGFSDDDLVSHYFQNVCTLYSCFDSDMNPFRSLVAEAWTDCKTTRLSIESMSVGHLANFYPHMASLGIAKRSQAWLSLQHDLQLLREGKQDKDRVLLCLLLQGLSSTWHQASNLGLQYLFVARGMIQTRLQQSGSSESSNDQFFLDALLHWEMLASFVDPVPLLSLPGLKCPSLPVPSRQDGVVSPHPWTGIASTLHFVIAEVGRILRRNRYVAGPNIDARRKEHLRAADAEWAEKLEDSLASAEICDPEQIADYGDTRTPKTDLVRMAQAYRYIGLLELYATFPELLQHRISNEMLPKDLAFLSMPTDNNNMGYASEHDLRLTAIANHILDSIKPISIISAACRLLPLVLLSLASQLRLPDGSLDEILENRYFLEARMLTLSRKYAQRPILQMMEIVKEVWSRLDKGTAGAHWMDVAHDRAWLTMFG